jgi:hypothetical protein
MKPRSTTHQQNQAGSALALTLILSALALAILASVMAWSASSARMTHRSIQYTRSVAAAEAATEKVVGQITRDFLYGGEKLVVNNLNTYRQNTVPTTADSAYWSTWQFNDANGNTGRTFVQRTNANSYIVLDSTYAGLKGYASTYTVVAHASDTASIQDVTGGVLQELQLVGIPIFQFAMYSSGNMEISCGKPFDVTGRVHSNKKLYIEPDSFLTFESGVTAVLDILFQRDPVDPRGIVPGGGVVYVHPDEKISPVAAMTLPIGTTNTPEAIREIIEPPPVGEDPNSPIGRLRYYNQSDLLVVVSDSGITASSGGFNNFSTSITNIDLQKFVSTNANFRDEREGKTVLPIDIDVGSLKTWSETNSTLRPALITANLSPVYVMNSVYVVDRRTLPGSSLGAVRVLNGSQLPTNGLTVATGRPLYVQGDYNSDTATRGTANTTTTRPASLVADAITILSDNWLDARSTLGKGSRVALPTTVNAAFLTGVVETTSAHYSGGMENFPRFLESWGPVIFTYNGSMVKMFPSLHATGFWNGTYYDPPTRNWAYDSNFENPTKLPPKTPSLLKVFRTRWGTAAPGQNVATTYP